MKKITKKAVEALFEKRDFKESNTCVEYILQPHSETSEMSIFGNTIARYYHRAEELQIFNCGWFTQTTKERLNGILKAFNGSDLTQRAGKWLIRTDDGYLDFEEGMTLNKYAEEVA